VHDPPRQRRKAMGGTLDRFPDVEIVGIDT